MSSKYYNYFRDYDPTIGRYTQSDPIGLAGGLNTYGYVGGNPLGSSDPLGLYEQDRVIVGDPDSHGRCPPGTRAERSMFTGLQKKCTRMLPEPQEPKPKQSPTARCGLFDLNCRAGLPRSTSTPARDACIAKCLLGLGVESEVQGRAGIFGANEAAKNSTGTAKSLAKGVARYFGPVGAAATVGGLIFDPNSCARQCDANQCPTQ